MSTEKVPMLPLPSGSDSNGAARRSSVKIVSMLLGTIALLGALRFVPSLDPTFLGRPFAHYRGCHAASLAAAQCPRQPSGINVGTDWDPVHDELYAELAARRLSQAVQHDTQSFDSYIPLEGNDPALDKHYAFADWMYNEYPNVFNALKHEVINYHGQLLTWEGSNQTLKPIVLMAHTDTVPVPDTTLDQWTYPPFEGRVVVNATKETPGTWIWGRGSSDCKNQLMGILGAVERLVSEGFEPERSIIVASGYDEEISGRKGAGALAKTLQERYGSNSIALLVDEGFDGVSEAYGAQVASFGMAEKGYLNVDIKVETPGGHSSVPPEHTGIGIMSLIINHLESHPFHPSLLPQSPYLQWLTCMSDHAPNFPEALARKVKHPRTWPRLAHQLAKSDRKLNSFLATTQAVDLIQGGVKINALPEVVTAQINHRIAFTSSVKETLEHVKDTLVPFAKTLNFTVSAFSEQAQHKSSHHITLSQWGEGGLEPAPMTPSDSKAFELMAGTTKHVFGEKTIVAPSGMFANTDTRWFWNLTEHLYRFSPAILLPTFNVHTVNEKMPLEGHLTTTRFFYKLIRNTEGWNAE